MIRKMNISRNLNLKEYILSGLYKLTNSFSSLTVNNLRNDYVKCIWEIGRIDNLRIEFSNSCFFAIRLFDISNNRNHSTCIMKEIEISKFQSSITFPIPINKGVYYFEFGYRKKDGEWRKLAYQKLNLGYRIKKLLQSFDNDSWFDPKIRIRKNEVSLHEEAYQLSLNSVIGGSENIS